MAEVLLTYFGLMWTYPWAFFLVAVDQAAWLLAWLVLGVFTLLVLRRRRRAALAFGALWFLPGTIVCGSAMLVPLPYAAAAAFGPTECGSLFSVALCSALNLVLVGGVAAAISSLRNRVARA